MTIVVSDTSPIRALDFRDLLEVLGILLSAKQRGIVPAVRPLVDQLRDGLGFFVSESLYQEVMWRAKESG